MATPVQAIIAPKTEQSNPWRPSGLPDPQPHSHGKKQDPNTDPKDDRHTPKPLPQVAEPCLVHDEDRDEASPWNGEDHHCVDGYGRMPQRAEDHR